MEVEVVPKYPVDRSRRHSAVLDRVDKREGLLQPAEEVERHKSPRWAPDKGRRFPVAGRLAAGQKSEAAVEVEVTLDIVHLERQGRHQELYVDVDRLV